MVIKMNNEIKEKIYNLRTYLGTEENWLLNDIQDYITNLQKHIQDLQSQVAYLKDSSYECARDNNITINFIGIMDYIRDKDLELDHLRMCNNRLNERINKAIKYICNDNIDVCTVRYNDIQNVKNELLDILKGGDE